MQAQLDPLAPQILLELGGAIVLLAVLARLAHRVGLSPIPLYLVAGLILGEGGLLPLSFGEDFIQVGAEIGVVLLLFLLGLEYTGEELAYGLQRGWVAGLWDLVLNFVPGVLVGLALGWGLVPALLLGGVTYNTSSGIMAKVLGDLGRLGNRETPAVLTLSVMEDLANAVYLPLIGILLLGVGLVTGALSVVGALATVALVLALAIRFGPQLSRILNSRTDEVVLLTVFGLVVLVAGAAERLQLSAAIAAFLLGIALSEPLADRARALIGPLRDLFAATFFLFFGLQIDPGQLPDVLALAVGLAALTTVTKVITGWVAAARIGASPRGRVRAGAAMVPRGEFSIVIAGLGVTAGIADIGPLSAAYVLVLAVISPVLIRHADTLARLLPSPRLQRSTR